jgi:gamma-glutamylcyclotransferase (GGCT)/AIG2-like uncharacterized protein YtfP
VKRLFVYGTLMEGGGQGGLLSGCARRPATIRGELFRMPPGYPALRWGGDDVVHGELVQLRDAAILAVLDAYEGVDQGLYARAVHPVRVGLRPIPAWVYVMRDPMAQGGVPIAGGRWRPAGRR